MERFEPYTVHRTQSWAKGNLVHTENDDHEDNYIINYISLNIKQSLLKYRLQFFRLPLYMLKLVKVGWILIVKVMIVHQL